MGLEAGGLAQFIKYGAAGATATVLHIIAFFLLSWKVFPALSANDVFVKLFGIETQVLTDALRARNCMLNNTITFFFTNMVAYVLNILCVFKRGRHHIVVEILLFYAVSAVSLVIGTGLMGFLISHFGMQTTYAFIANIVTSVMINYAMRKFVIFKA
jgi:putative flippase GtrA